MKTKEFPSDVEDLQMLSRRVRPTHMNYPQIQEKLALELAGYKGEKALEYPLSFLPNEYLIFYDVRLYDGSHYFQNDTIVLSRSWILLIEAKNMAGKLHYDQANHQLVRTLENEVQAFDSPVTQVRRHRRELEKWLHEHRLPQMPIYCLVAHSHPHSVISTNNPKLNIIIRTYNLPEKIAELTAPHSNTVLSPSQLQHVSSAILNYHSSHRYDYISHFKITEADLLEGVYCSECRQLPMIRRHGTWLCPKCGHRRIDAHMTALHDYYLFSGSKITNAKLRKFLNIGSPATANRILRSLRAERYGNNRGRVYQLTKASFD